MSYSSSLQKAVLPGWLMVISAAAIVKHILDACWRDSQTICSVLVLFWFLFLFCFLALFVPSTEDSSSREAKGRLSYAGSPSFRTVMFRALRGTSLNSGFVCVTPVIQLKKKSNTKCLTREKRKKKKITKKVFNNLKCIFFFFLKNKNFQERQWV